MKAKKYTGTTNEQFKEAARLFEEAVKPLMKYMEKYHHPHMTAIIDSTNAQLVEGQMSYNSAPISIEEELSNDEYEAIFIRLKSKFPDRFN